MLSPKLNVNKRVAAIVYFNRSSQDVVMHLCIYACNVPEIGWSALKANLMISSADLNPTDDLKKKTENLW